MRDLGPEGAGSEFERVDGVRGAEEHGGFKQRNRAEGRGVPQAEDLVGSRLGTRAAVREKG